MFSPLPCLATFSRSMMPRKPDSRANSEVISGKPIGVIESISMAPSSIGYRAPTLTCGYFHIRTLQVISPRRTPSRKRFVNTMGRGYTSFSFLCAHLHTGFRCSRSHGHPLGCLQQIATVDHDPLACRAFHAQENGAGLDHARGA